MKRIFAFVLTMLVLLSLAACNASVPTPEKDEGVKKEDLSLLSAEELYERGLQKTRALSNFRAETEISLGEEVLYTVETTRIREGYDGFSYARKGGDSLYFSEGKVYAGTSLGLYTADATARDVQDYLNGYFFSVQLLDSEKVTDLKKEDMILSFALKDEAVLALFANAVPEEKGTFAPESMEGKIRVTEDGVFQTEEYAVLGRNGDGESVSLNLKTEIVGSRESDIAIAIPEGEYNAVSDIRIPHYFHDAEKKLASSDSVQATILTSETVTEGDQNWSFHREETYYQKDRQNAYLSRQTLKNLPPLPEGAEAPEEPVKTRESLFYQYLLENGSKKESEYDVLTGTLLSEKQADGAASDWAEILSSVLLDPASLGEWALSKDHENITISFSLNETGVRKLAERLTSHLPESGRNASEAVGTGSGVLTLSADTNVLTAFSVMLEGTSSSASFSCRHSLTVDATENIVFPQWQTPTATAPGEMGEAGDHNH